MNIKSLTDVLGCNGSERNTEDFLNCLDSRCLFVRGLLHKSQEKNRLGDILETIDVQEKIMVGLIELTIT